MLFELRTYTIRPGRLAAYVADFEHRGLPVIGRHAELVAYWIAEVGALNQVVHVWRYRDAAHRAEHAQACTPTGTGPTGTCPRRSTTSSIKNRAC